MSNNIFTSSGSSIKSKVLDVKILLIFSPLKISVSKNGTVTGDLTWDFWYVKGESIFKQMWH